MDFADGFDLSFQGWDDGVWQHGHAVLVSLAMADADEVFVEIDVFDSEGQAFGEAESGAIEQACHEEFVTVEECEHGADFGGGEDNGEAFGADGVGDFADLAEFPVEYLPVEEDDGIECLVLGGGRDFEVCGEVSEESADFFASHGERVFFVVEEDKSFDPVGIGLDGSGAEVTECGCSADEVEEFGLRHG